jgi:hypothetical protein
MTSGAPGAALRGPKAALSWKVGTGAAVTRGALEAALRGPRAALSWEVRTRAAMTRGAPRAALRDPGTAVTCGAPEAALCREAGATPGAALSWSIVGCF